MKLKKIWKKLPLRYQVRYRSFGKKLYYLINLLTLGQVLQDDIGRVPVSLLVKPYLKRSFSQQGEDLVLDRIITRVLKWDINISKFYVDIGAYHPIDHSVTYLLYKRGWRGIAFDPSFITKQSFRFWRPKDIFVQAVVGKEDGINVEFYIPKGASDMNLTNTKYPINKKNYSSKKLGQINLNDELKRQGIEKIDVINIDVEGAELEILKNLEFEIYTPAIIIIEIHGNDIRKCLETDEAKLIISKGYKAVGCVVITYFFVKESEIENVLV
jgi:FkbM family methyltransferase